MAAKRKNTKTDYYVMGFVMIVISVIMVIGFSVSIKNAKEKISRCSEVTEGTVENVRSEVRRRRNTSKHGPRYKTETYYFGYITYTVDGEECFIEEQTKNRTTFKVGDKVEVFYDPDRPLYAYTNKTKPSTSPITLIIAVVPFIMAVIFLAKGSKAPKAPKLYTVKEGKGMSFEEWQAQQKAKEAMGMSTADYSQRVDLNAEAQNERSYAENLFESEQRGGGDFDM
ncbi:MAG: DUF3592 domain-containing protein [Oscillospiraceae bacterium]